MSDEIQLKTRSCHIEEPPEPPQVEDPVGPPLPGLAPEVRAPKPEPQPMSLVRFLDEPLWRARGWIQLLGVLNIISGALMVLSILAFNIMGPLMGWLPIWLGMILCSASKNIRYAAELDDQEAMKIALGKIALFFKIQGVLVIVGLILGLAGGIAVALGVIGSAAMMGQNMPIQ